MEYCKDWDLKIRLYDQISYYLSTAEGLRVTQENLVYKTAKNKQVKWVTAKEHNFSNIP